MARSARPSTTRATPARAFAVAGLLVALVGALLVAWFVAGWADVRGQQRMIRDAPGRAADARGAELAHDLRGELGAVITREVERPYFHYQNLFHDPRASAGPSVTPSPLVGRPEDPLVLGYFQRDAQGRMTTPAINDDVPELSDQRRLAEHRRFRDEARRSLAGPLAVRSRGPLVVSTAPSAPSASTAPGAPAVAVASNAAPSRPAPRHVRPAPKVSPQAQTAQVVTIDPDVYSQNVSSNAVYLQQRTLPQAQLEPRAQVEPQAQVDQQAQVEPQMEQQAQLAPQMEQQTAPEARVPRTMDEEPPLPSPAATPPAPAVTPPSRVVTPPSRVVTPPSRVVTPPSRVVTPRSRAVAPRSPAASPPAEAASPASIAITVSPFEWRTFPFAGQPALVAVRQIETPDGRLAQGFVIDRTALTTWLASRAGDAVAELRTGDDGSTEVAPGWHLEVAANPRALAAAATDARAVARGFVARFVAIGLIAVIGALLVVMLVARAERLARERSQFAAAAAHELRTPLAGLQLYGDMLADGLGDPTKLRDYARRMSEEAARLGRVVSNVLGFSQLERGNLSVAVRAGAVDEALQSIAERAEPALTRAGATLVVDVAPGLAARFDHDALARIVGNLLDNAEKYGRSSGDRTITLAARATTTGAEVSVSDRGPGIAASVRSRLFQPFARGVEAPAGLGLGLALSQSLARAMGGELAYRAAPDGAVFVLTLDAT